MTVSFDQLTVNGRAYPMRGTVTQAIEGEGIKGEAARIGAGAGVGAIIGGILGGFKGALAGILIGGGGTIAATEGKEVELPQGTVLRVRLDSPAADRQTDGASSTVRGNVRRIARLAPRRSSCFTCAVGVRRRQEPRLELRRRRVDAARQHAPEERRVRARCSARERRLRSRAPATSVKNGVRSEPNALTCSGTPASRAASARPAASIDAARGQVLVELRREPLQRPQARGHRHRISRQRARLIDRSRRRHHLHDRPRGRRRRRPAGRRR